MVDADIEQIESLESPTSIEWLRHDDFRERIFFGRAHPIDLGKKHIGYNGSFDKINNALSFEFQPIVVSC